MRYSSTDGTARDITCSIVASFATSQRFSFPMPWPQLYLSTYTACCGHNVRKAPSNGLSAVDAPRAPSVSCVVYRLSALSFSNFGVYATAVESRQVASPSATILSVALLGWSGRAWQQHGTNVLLSNVALYGTHLHLPLLALVELSLQLQRHDHQRTRCCCSSG